MASIMPSSIKLSQAMVALKHLQISLVTSSGNGALSNRHICSSALLSTAKKDNSSSKIPPKPQPPLRPWVVYALKIQQQKKKVDPDSTYKSTLKEASTMWKNLSLHDKAKLEHDYRVKSERYRIEQERYEKNLTPEQLETVTKIHKGKGKSIRQREMERKALGKPKRPLNPYFLYMEEKKKETDLTGYKFGEFAKESAVMWQNLDDMSKQKYFDMAIKQKEVYEQEWAAWSAKMERIGREDLIPNKPKDSV